MQVISSRRPLISLGALALALAVLVTAGVLWYYWPQILWQSTLWQRVLHQQMAGLLQQVSTRPARAGVSLLLFSLLYGVLHALGPGHGKVVITTFLATHPARLATTLRLTLLASLLQGVIAIALVTLLLVVLQTSARQLHLGSYWLEKGSYLLVAALGVWIGARALKRLWLASRRPAIRAIRPDHHHSASCGCGHAHLPDPQQVAQAVSIKTQLLLVLAMGFRPCSGAIMMLLFAQVINVYTWGVLSALVMALGTGLTISTIGLLVQRSRAQAERLTQQGNARRMAQWVALLALVGSVILFVAGIALWQSAVPGSGGGIRPFG